MGKAEAKGPGTKLHEPRRRPRHQPGHLLRTDAKTKARPVAANVYWTTSSRLQDGDPLAPDRSSLKPNVAIPDDQSQIIARCIAEVIGLAACPRKDGGLSCSSRRRKRRRAEMPR